MAVALAALTKLPEFNGSYEAGIAVGIDSSLANSEKLCLHRISAAMDGQDPKQVKIGCFTLVMRDLYGRLFRLFRVSNIYKLHHIVFIPAYTVMAVALAALTKLPEFNGSYEAGIAVGIDSSLANSEKLCLHRISAAMDGQDPKQVKIGCFTLVMRDLYGRLFRLFHVSNIYKLHHIVFIPAYTVMAVALAALTKLPEFNGSYEAGIAVGIDSSLANSEKLCLHRISAAMDGQDPKQVKIGCFTLVMRDLYGRHCSGKPPLAIEILIHGVYAGIHHGLISKPGEGTDTVFSDLLTVEPNEADHYFRTEIDKTKLLNALSIAIATNTC